MKIPRSRSPQSQKLRPDYIFISLNINHQSTKALMLEHWKAIAGEKNVVLKSSEIIDK